MQLIITIILSVLLMNKSISVPNSPTTTYGYYLNLKLFWAYYTASI